VAVGEESVAEDVVDDDEEEVDEGDELYLREKKERRYCREVDESGTVESGKDAASLRILALSALPLRL